MTYDISNVSEADLKRFTACWLNSDMTTNWNAAASTFDPEGKFKVASFKTVTGRASAKVTGEKPKKAASAAAAAAAGGKRKRAEGRELGEQEKSKAKKGRKGKKAKAEDAEGEVDLRSLVWKGDGFANVGIADEGDGETVVKGEDESEGEQ